MSEDIPITVGFEKKEPGGTVNLAQKVVLALESGNCHLVPTLLKEPDGTTKVVEFSIAACPHALPAYLCDLEDDGVKNLASVSLRRFTAVVDERDRLDEHVKALGEEVARLRRQLQETVKVNAERVTELEAQLTELPRLQALARTVGEWLDGAGPVALSWGPVVKVWEEINSPD